MQRDFMIFSFFIVNVVCALSVEIFARSCEFANFINRWSI